MIAPRVVSIVNRYPSPSETFIERKARALRAVGFDVTVAAHRVEANPGPDPVPTMQLPLARSPRTWMDVAGRLSGDAAARRRAAGLRGDLRRHHGLLPVVAGGFDLVHFEFSGIAAAMVDALPALRPARLAVSCRGGAEHLTPLRDPERARRLERVFEEVDLVHCVSEEMADVARGYGADEAKILVNRPAVDAARWAGIGAVDPEVRGTAERPLRVLSVARLHWNKAFDDAVRAVAVARRAGLHVRYRIVGEGPEREKLQYLRHGLGIEEEVELVGWQRQEDLPAHLAWADAFLLSSLTEGISNSALEAMAAGVPVVSTRCGGMAEVLGDGVGVLVEVGERDEMAAALESLSDPDRRAALARAGEAIIGREYDLARQAAVFADAYRRVLGLPAAVTR